MVEGQLARALLEFQKEAPSLVKDGRGNFGKYVTLDGIMERVRPILNKHGLVLTQLPSFIMDGTGNAVPALTTRLTHESGEFIEDTMMLLLDKQHSQGLGSALTYARRYSITAVLALVGDEDDDGQAASTPPKRAQSSSNPATPAPAPATSFEVPEGARGGQEARDMTPATETSKKKLKALAAKLIGEGKATQTQLDSAMIAAAQKSWEPALADPVLPKAVVDDFLTRLGNFDKNAAEKAQQEVAA
jgi:hypothetical protein